MKRYFNVLAVLAVCVVSFGFLNCPENWVEPVRPKTELISVYIQPVDLDLNNMPINRPGVKALEVEAIPTPILENDWMDNFYNITEADSEELWFLLQAHIETARVVASVTEGCTVQWGIGTSGTRPAFFTNPNQPLPFVNNDMIYIKVSTRDDKYSSYYRIFARLASPVTLISGLTIAGRELPIAFDDGNESWDALKIDEEKELPLSIAYGEGLAGASLLVTKMDDNSYVKYAMVPRSVDYTTYTVDQLDFKYSENEPITVFNPEKGEDEIKMGSSIVLNDQDVIIAQVLAQNENDKNYYKFRVSVGRIATIAKLTLNTVEVGGLGLPSSAWSDVIAGAFGTAEANPLADSYIAAVNVELQDPDASWEFAKADKNKPSQPPAFSLPGSGTIDISNKDFVVLKIMSKSPLLAGGSDPAVTMYYQVRIDFLAAQIKDQPLSAVYYVQSFDYPRTPVHLEATGNTYQRVLISAQGSVTLDKTIQPLSVTLDRAVEEPTYQWYTANSWYGGYGFDRYGHVVGDPPCPGGVQHEGITCVGFLIDANSPGFSDGYHPSTDRGGLDEKNNISFHNGGNSFYRLPIGYPLDAPKLDYDFARRGGYSSGNSGSNGPAGFPGGFMLPYPGIKISAADGGTSATYTPKIGAATRPFISGYSNQTQYYWVVVTGKNGRTIESERAVIVTEWGEKWEKGEPTGDKVTKKHHIVDLNKDLGSPKRNLVPFTFKREKALIPITFPSGFNVWDYSVATIQAVFYLADGRTWIQNWTQGDIGFERNGVGQVLYYNLTNNNATLGLSGDSKEPQGANLEDTPTHVVVKPAGEKPVNRMPDFLADGITPKNINDAQGWFCQYIEIVELRFEGPKR